MLNEENLVATLEQSLRQTRNAQNRLLGRLHEVETEADSLRNEIEALGNSAEKTEEAIYSIIATMGTGNKTRMAKKQSQSQYENDDYELQNEARLNSRTNVNNRNNSSSNSNNYRNNSVAYINNNSRNAPPSNSKFEPGSHRFTDRTITQACTLLLREINSPLHVGELYNLLLEGGFEFKGNNPTISIAVSLNRNRRFRKVAPGTFDLVMRNASQQAASK